MSPTNSKSSRKERMIKEETMRMNHYLNEAPSTSHRTGAPETGSGGGRERARGLRAGEGRGGRDPGVKSRGL